MRYTYLITTLSLLLFSCGGNQKEENQESTVETVMPDLITQVTVETLHRGDFYHELISNGKLTAHNQADLYFESAEPIEKILVKNGDRVTKGQPIASLATFKLANQTIQMRNTMELARLEFQDLLIGQGYALADSLQVPPATMELVLIKSGYNNAVAQYELALFQEKNAILKAPFDGIVANITAKPHNIASTAEPFCTILDSRNLEVSFTVLENELPLIKSGDRVEITPFSMPDVQTIGRISEINPVVDENGMVQIKASLQNNGKLFEGMNVRVKVQRVVPGQLVVPKTALVLRSGKQVVFTLTPDNKAYWHYVETGLENSTSYVIIDGLEDGSTVITSGNINLAHESPVEITAN